MTEKLDLELLRSAKDFLTEALRNEQRGRLNFAIVHGVTAVELVLKARLARENPALILRNIDTANPDSEPSVSLRALPRRLANLGLPLGASNTGLIRQLATWRNGIVHHMPSFEPNAARHQVPELLDFIASYLREQLDTPIETFLPPDLLTYAEGRMSDWREVVEKAREAARAEGRLYRDESCPTCGHTDVVVFRDGDCAYCHLCEREFHVETCEGCSRRFLASRRLPPDESYCPSCADELADAAGDAYMSWYEDWLRGK